MEPSQDEQSHLGKIVRLELDGTPAGDGAIDGALPDIWSMGHRNILGMDFDAQGRLWEVEHGPAGGDELNLVQKVPITAGRCARTANITMVARSPITARTTVSPRRRSAGR